MIKLADTGQTVLPPADDVRGRRLTSRDGEDLGKIRDLLVDDHAQQVRFLVAEHGGLLGIGATESFLPVEAITEITSDEVTVDTDRDGVAGAPRYDPDLGADRGYYESVYHYYGYPGIWGTGATGQPFPPAPPLGRRH